MDTLGFSGYVAILDDDDEWEPLHLEAARDVAATFGADVVVSGLRHMVDGVEVPRTLPKGLQVDHFLAGNPGWQGSNTFILQKILVRSGGFREGLPSLNDRDLAVRVLSDSDISIAYTNLWTARWYHRNRETLSAPRSPAKIAGLRMFWRLYRSKMSDSVEQQFFSRAANYFGIDRNEIVEPPTVLLSVPSNEREATSFPQRRMLRFWPAAERIWFVLKGAWRKIRVKRPITRLLGPQYQRSRDQIEIDITYACNLRCINCNRSVSQAPDDFHLPVRKVREFVDESICREKRWRRIRVLGGEPTLHPHFLEIVGELQRYREWWPACTLEVVTNGFGEVVNKMLERLTPDVWVENSHKTSSIQPSFRPFNIAPIDLPSYRNADFTNGCAIMNECGMGLTPMGYYQCAIAGGIDRIAGLKMGLDVLPDDDQALSEQLHTFCRFCGRFLDGHYIPLELRPQLNERKNSPTWEQLYLSWRSRRSAPEDL